MNNEMDSDWPAYDSAFLANGDVSLSYKMW